MTGTARPFSSKTSAPMLAEKYRVWKCADFDPTQSSRPLSHLVRFRLTNFTDTDGSAAKVTSWLTLSSGSPFLIGTDYCITYCLTLWSNIFRKINWPRELKSAPNTLPLPLRLQVQRSLRRGIFQLHFIELTITLREGQIGLTICDVNQSLDSASSEIFKNAHLSIDFDTWCFQRFNFFFQATRLLGFYSLAAIRSQHRLIHLNSNGTFRDHPFEQFYDFGLC